MKVITVSGFNVLLQEEPQCGFTVTMPSLSGRVTYGETLDEAMSMAKEAIELYVESLKEHGEDIPNENDVLEYTIYEIRNTEYGIQLCPNW